MKTSIDKKIYFINIFVLFIFSTLIIYLLYTTLYEQKASLLRQAENKTETTARFISADIDRFIFSVGEIIEGIHNIDEFLESHTDIAQLHEDEVEIILTKSLRPYIMNILVLDENLNDTHWADNKKKQNSLNRKYIHSHFKETNSDEILISSPEFIQGVDNKWFFTISKGFFVEGHLHSVIIVFFDIDFFMNRYNNSILDKSSSVFITSNNGEIYLSYPHKKGNYRKIIPEVKEFFKTNFFKKHYYSSSEKNKQKILSTLIHSKNYAIITKVSILTSTFLDPWEQNRERIILIAVILTLGFIVLIIYYSKLQMKLVRLTQYDGLTKLFNRGYFIDKSEYEYNRALRYKENLSIIMLDIDDFKIINDTYGHQKGDEVIKNVTRHIKENIREIDFAGRYGGEEFIILLPKTKQEKALIVANRIQDAIETNKYSSNISATLSIGISSLNENDINIDSIISRADKALYISKENGKNCINIL